MITFIHQTFVHIINIIVYSRILVQSSDNSDMILRFNSMVISSDVK